MSGQIQPNGLVTLPATLPDFIEPFLPVSKIDRPFVTLTYAQSIDAKIAITGERTVISHIETKTMTHYLRSKHDSILIGYKTAQIDDPKLNNRFDSHSIRPIILDPLFQWDYKDSSLEKLCTIGEGLPPVFVVKKGTVLDPKNADKVKHLQQSGGSLLEIESDDHGVLPWVDIFKKLYDVYGLQSIMVEGGANIIKQLLVEKDLVDSLIVTIGSTYLGSKGVDISPPKTITLKDVDWWKGTTDSVLVARLQ